MTVNELIQSLQEMQQKGFGNNEVVFKDGWLYYQCILYGACRCAKSNGDIWRDYYPSENVVPMNVNTEEDFYNLIILE